MFCKIGPRFVSLPFQYYDLAADVLAENATLTYKFLSTVSTVLSKLCVLLSKHSFYTLMSEIIKPVLLHYI